MWMMITVAASVRSNSYQTRRRRTCTGWQEERLTQFTATANLRLIYVRRHCGSSHFGSSRDPGPRLEFPLHLPSWQPPQDSFESEFLFAGCVHRMAPVACRPSVRARSLWLNMGIKLGRSQPRAGIVERLLLTPMSPLPISCRARGTGRRRVAVTRSLLQCLVGPVGYSGVIRHRNRRYQMTGMRSWKTARSHTRQTSTGRSRQTTNCGKFPRQC